MDKNTFEQMLKMMQSENDTDALLGLRGLQGLFRHDGVDFGQGIAFLLQNMDRLKPASPTIDQAAATPAAAQKSPVAISGMPQCHAPRSGCIELIAAGATEGLVVPLPGASADDAEMIANNMKDALVAASINKSRFKLKVVDVKNGRGEIIETSLQAEYERDGMAAVRVWVNVRGEVAALANVLRKAVANALPEYVAA
ncbi:MAG: hypothetical protein PW788_07135 [Micavibrio sp.]|nr:hypothetical protein [Micavibrio sp.]